MKRELFWTVVLCSCLVSVGRAQTVTGSGTPHTIPQFTSPTSIGDSPIIQFNGNIGIYRSDPTAILDVVDRRDVNASGGGPTAVVALSTCTLFNFCSAVRGNANNGVAIGVLGVNFAQDGKDGGSGIYGQTLATTGFAFGAVGEASGATGNTVGVYGRNHSPGGVAGLFVNGPGGNILVGGVGPFGSPTTVFRVDGEGTVFADGGFRGTGADFAELLPVKGSPAHYAPGDLLVIDPSGERRLALSQTQYSTLVAGIYSTKPGVVASQHRMDDPALGNEVPLAVLGIVPCKVTAENGSIVAGDLLVTSSTPGHAMKGTDRARMLGAVVGKALEPLRGGKGVIQVLVTLQ